MPGSSGSERSPAWLRRRVLLRAWWLEAVNRATAKGSPWQLATALLGAGGVLAWLVTCGSTGMRLKILVSICCLAAIETVKHHLALPCALLFSGWQLNRASRS
jgi:hypothetical protein